MITILSVIGGTIILYFDFSQENQAKGFEEAIKTVLSILYTLQYKLIQIFAIYWLITSVLLVMAILYFICKFSKNKEFKSFIQKLVNYIFSDWNWLWLYTLIFVIHLFLSNNLLPAITVENTTCKNITAKDFLLFLLPVIIWAWCLVKILHQMIYTWRIRNISRNTLESQKYLEQL